MMNGPLDESLGAQVRARRLEGGLSESELASRIGVPLGVLRDFERGRSRITASRLEDIGRELALPPLAFFADAAVPPGAEGEVREGWASERDRIRLLRAFGRIKDRNVRLCVISLLEQITEANDLAEELLEQVVRSR